MLLLRRFTALIFSLMVLGTSTLLIFSASTESTACCGDGVVAAAGAEAAGASVVTAVGSATTSIITQLQLMDQNVSSGFGRLYEELAKQTAAQRTFEQGAISAQTQMYMEERRAEAEEKYALSPRACFETASGVASTVAAGETKEAVNDLNRLMTDRTLNTPNTAAAIGRIYKDHAEKYCSARDAQLGRCTAVAAELQNADVRADVLLGSASLTPAQSDAAKALVANIVNPIPTQNIPTKWENTAQGRAFVSGQLLEQARTSVAANSLNQAVAARTRIPGLGSAAMLNRADVSEREMMEAQVRGRFESPDWYKMLAAMSTENLLRELNKQSAFGLWMDYREFSQMERIESLLATDLAVTVKQDSEKRLQQARSAAAKAR
ncbi:hypothetical protein [Xanthomonas campestris]|uniref:hypothetical protein n=1 Tax=Xanthomonas campestris TaxID=339 RepID=UPI001C851117|nr:hypothetical protein [Xanthomonas campestris]MCF8869906.1 hypothetical protein [Xanthomonas campestris pv. campestris]MDM7718702.1 hypothetical protein [Xanthomonas campestris pv. campestris]MEA0953202.1 hypothetical protein [Xanthomonas campestris pv. campestris]MEB1105603.1 hypothetical protein [Xanthomonas campestris pv. campestris]MEB1623905.1 hypothetical protein [Xanthomonas campestris pv. campestris]